MMTCAEARPSMRNSTVLQMYQQQAYLRSGVELRQSSERPAVPAFSGTTIEIAEDLARRPGSTRKQSDLGADCS